MTRINCPITAGALAILRAEVKKPQNDDLAYRLEEAQERFEQSYPGVGDLNVRALWLSGLLLEKLLPRLHIFDSSSTLDDLAAPARAIKEAVPRSVEDIEHSLERLRVMLKDKELDDITMMLAGRSTPFVKKERERNAESMLYLEERIRRVLRLTAHALRGGAAGWTMIGRCSAEALVQLEGAEDTIRHVFTLMTVNQENAEPWSQ